MGVELGLWHMLGRLRLSGRLRATERGRTGVGKRENCGKAERSGRTGSCVHVVAALCVFWLGCAWSLCLSCLIEGF